jgi:1,4-dihydroxy-2-naphthoyl-CoA hydrolase
MSNQPHLDANHFNQFGLTHLPQHLGIQIMEVGQGVLKAQLQVQQHHLAPNGFLHAASVVALADTAAGYACLAHLPSQAESFTTLELKSNFLSSARVGEWVSCTASAVHLGKTTQVWQAQVFNANSQRLMASFSCTQLLLNRK